VFGTSTSRMPNPTHPALDALGDITRRTLQPNASTHCLAHCHDVMSTGKLNSPNTQWASL
jgi:hypothetical protein